MKDFWVGLYVAVSILCIFAVVIVGMVLLGTWIASLV